MELTLLGQREHAGQVRQVPIGPGGVLVDAIAEVQMVGQIEPCLTAILVDGLPLRDEREAAAGLISGGNALVAGSDRRGLRGGCW